MFIFDQPYISDVAAEFLVESQAPLLANDFSKESVSGEANHISEEEAVRQLEEQEFRWLYSNSENAIAWIVDTFGADCDLARKIDLFKDKSRFREATASLFPDIRFFKIPAVEIETLTFERVGQPFIIKPTVGFISAGVYRVNNAVEWGEVQGQILQATEEAARAFPGEVLNGESFIVESIIPGDEYAVDAYFDDQNKPVILNILHHRFRDEHDMSDRLYVTSAEIIKSRLAPIEDFLTDIAGLGDFRGLPVHAEIRIDSNDKIRPIEINPLRFAGWCSTDIAYYSYGINVYDCFANRKKPEWESVLAGRESETYAMAVIERPGPISGDQVFDYEKLGNSLSSLLGMRKMDYRTFSLYAFVFFSVGSENEGELDMILELDPNRFVRDLENQYG